MDVRPIRSEVDHDAAVARIESLMGQGDLSAAEEAEIDILATLIDAWEDKHVPIAPPDPIEAIIFRMEQMGYGQTDLANLLGSRSRASEILNRKRALTLEQVRILNAHWQVPAESLIADYVLAR